MKSKYEQRGVSFSKDDVYKAIAGKDIGIVPGTFCKIIPDILTNDENYAILMHADGAGTKSALAYAYWKETGNIDVWKGIAWDAIIMNIDDMICAGALDGFVVSSTIGRNKNNIPGEVISAIINGFDECIAFLNEHGFHTLSSGGETADIGDLVRTVVVDSTVTARMSRNQIISNHAIKNGDVIIGLASFGKTTYEHSYNSGIGSNGLTSARHDLFCHALVDEYPETFDPDIDDSVVYSGKYTLTDPSPVPDTDMGTLLLSPTRTYAPVIKKILHSFRPHIHGMIHCTGGGQTKVLKYVKNIHIVKNNLFVPPPVFQLIREQSDVSEEEMYQVFNMGHRMELYVSPEIAQEIIDVCFTFELEAKIIGYCEHSESKKLTIQNNGNTYYFA